MKKTIIAAGAAVALAAMPVVSVFATTATPITDNLTVNLTKTCTVTRAGSVANATAANPSWSDATGTTTGTYTGSLTAGEMKTLGTSTFTVNCNDQEKGHSMNVTVTGLSSTDNGSDSDTMIPYANSTLTQGSTSGWNITTTANANLGTTAAVISTSGDETITGTVYGNKKAAVTAETFDATYSVAADMTQPSGTYTGSATYTLTFNV